MPDHHVRLAEPRSDAIRRALGEAIPASRQAGLLAGLLGRGIQESRTPAMHEAEGARLGLSYRYRVLDFDRMRLDDSDLSLVVLSAADAGFAGLNVTHPFKESIVGGLDSVAPEAAAIGAVNTVVLRHSARVGYNTDCWGFAESFRRGMHGASVDRVVLIGAGGAGMAIAHALLQFGVARLAISDIDQARAGALAEKFSPRRVIAIAASDLEAETRAASGVINATPVGMTKYPGMPVPVGWLRPDLWVADVVYFPLETAFLRAARQIGCRTLSGTGMAIFQAVKAFELITGTVPDAGAMARHFDNV